MYIIDNEFAKEVHENAVAHGWWEEKRSDGELLALIHSEWSEALEEYRCGREMIWYACTEVPSYACNPKDEHDCYRYSMKETCEYRSKKPEGIAVELSDGCIRILDMLAERGELTQEPKEEIEECDIARFGKTMKLPEFVSHLHFRTAHHQLKQCVCMVHDFLSVRGIDLYEVMRTKHQYNITRPYKHGGKKC